MIFLSYSWAQAESVVRMARRLKDAGLPYWLDSEHLDLGRDIFREITMAIRKADHIILIDTHASRSSPWVCFERRIARSYGKPVCPIHQDCLENLHPQHSRTFLTDARMGFGMPLWKV